MSDTNLKIVDQIFEEILGKSIGVDENIFDHGANSLTAMQIVSASNEKTGKNISLQKFFAAPTRRTLTAE